MTTRSAIERRAFLKGSAAATGGLLIGIYLHDVTSDAVLDAQFGPPGGGAITPQAFIRIGTDDVVHPKAETHLDTSVRCGLQQCGVQIQAGDREALRSRRGVARRETDADGLAGRTGRRDSGVRGEFFSLLYARCQ